MVCRPRQERFAKRTLDVFSPRPVRERDGGEGRTNRDNDNDDNVDDDDARTQVRRMSNTGRSGLP